MKKRGAESVVAVRRGKIIGVVTTLRHKGGLEILHIGVDKNVRKKGLGSWLLGKVKQLAKEDNVYKIVVRADLLVVNFFLKNGFYIAGDAFYSTLTSQFKKLWKKVKTPTVAESMEILLKKDINWYTIYDKLEKDLQTRHKEKIQDSEVERAVREAVDRHGVASLNVTMDHVMERIDPTRMKPYYEEFFNLIRRCKSIPLERPEEEVSQKETILVEDDDEAEETEDSEVDLRMHLEDVETLFSEDE